MIDIRHLLSEGLLFASHLEKHLGLIILFKLHTIHEERSII